MSTKTKKPAVKKPAVSITTTQENLTGFAGTVYWVLNDLPTVKLKEHLRALGIGIPKTKIEMVERIYEAANGGPARVTFSLAIF